MKRNSILLLALLLGYLPQAQTLTNKSSSITVSAASTLTVSGSISQTGAASMANNGTVQTSNDWSHDGSLLYSGSGTLELGGSGAQTVTATTFYNLLISGSGTKTASGSTTVTNLLSFTGSGTLVATSAAPILLGSSGSLSETANGYVDGWIQTTRSVAQGSAQSFGGLGLLLTANGAAPGTTTLRRGTGTTAIQTGSPNLGIARVFEISPAVNTGLQANLVFAYRDGELNGLSEASLSLFGSSDGGATWTMVGQVSRDASANTVTMAGISSLGKLTLGTGSSVLPLTWISFTGRAEPNSNVLQWRTAHERNTAYFAVERSIAGHPFAEIGRRTAAGNSAGERSYAFLDTATTSCLYRLRQVDLDGNGSYSSILRIERGPSGTGRKVAAYPNPFTDRITLRWSESPDPQMEYHLVLMDAGGRSVWQKTAVRPAGTGELSLEGLRGVPSGSYFLHVRASDGQRWLLSLYH